MFHGFSQGATPSGDEGKHLCGEKFDALLNRLSRVGTFLSLRELVTGLRERTPLPKRPIVLTFDDGYESNYRIAFPILRKYQAPASVFLATEFVFKSKYLWTDRIEFSVAASPHSSFEVGDVELALTTPSDRQTALRSIKSTIKELEQEDLETNVEAWESRLGASLSEAKTVPETFRPLTTSQIQEMDGSGLVEFGAHTHHHRILGRCQPDTIREEVVTSRNLIRNCLGKPCDLFCYPNGQPGDFSEVSARILREEGFIAALTTVTGTNNQDSDPIALQRYGVSDQAPLDWTLLEVCGVLPKLRRLAGRTA